MDKAHEAAAQNAESEDAAHKSADETAAAAEQAAIDKEAMENAAVLNDDGEFEDDGDDNDAPLTIDGLQAENIRLRTLLEKAVADAKADHEQMTRGLAEALNMKKRAENDVANERKYGNEKLIRQLLPVLESLDLAVAHMDKDNEATKSIYEGVNNTLTLFIGELKKAGCEVLNPEGEVFDPNLHQAMTMVPTANMEPNHVVAVMQKGYVLNGRLIKPAMVMVSKAPEEPQAPEEDNGNRINIEA